MQRLQVLAGHLSGSVNQTNQQLNSAATAAFDPKNDASNMQKLREQGGIAPAGLGKSKLTLAQWKEMQSKEVGVTEYFLVSQERVDAFALVTQDFQWIHGADAKKKGSPFGGPIAHGFLVLSLSSMFAESVMPKLDGAKMGVNYGLNKVRWTAPVPVGKRVRMRVGLKAVKDVENNGIENILELSVEVEGAKKPSMVAEWVTRAYF